VDAGVGDLDSVVTGGSVENEGVGRTPKLSDPIATVYSRNLNLSSSLSGNLPDSLTGNLPDSLTDSLTGNLPDSLADSLTGNLSSRLSSGLRSRLSSGLSSLNSVTGNRRRNDSGRIPKRRLLMARRQCSGLEIRGTSKKIPVWVRCILNETRSTDRGPNGTVVVSSRTCT